MLTLDLMKLETPKRFEALCVRLAQREFPEARPTKFESWDGGRDILHFSRLVGDTLVFDAVWQAKFTSDLGANTKKAIRKSIASITSRKDIEVHRWILCIPVDATGHFVDWVAREVSPLGWKFDVWDRSMLLQKLERNSDLIETFFWGTHSPNRPLRCALA